MSCADHVYEEKQRRGCGLGSGALVESTCLGLSLLTGAEHHQMPVSLRASPKSLARSASASQVGILLCSHCAA